MSCSTYSLDEKTTTLNGERWIDRTTRDTVTWFFLNSNHLKANIGDVITIFEDEHGSRDLYANSKFIGKDKK